MNNEFRGIEGPTDVLSYAYEQLDVPNEVYLSPEYISKSYSGPTAVEEVVRCIVHGVLHTVGYNHSGYFEEGSSEEMFVKQEDVVRSILLDLKVK